MKQFLFILMFGLILSSCNAPQKKTTTEDSGPAVMVEANLRVEGMTCDGCEQTVVNGVSLLAGIDSISANHEDSTAYVRFDASKTDLTKISEAIKSRGYEVVADTKVN